MNNKIENKTIEDLLIDNSRQADGGTPSSLINPLVPLSPLQLEVTNKVEVISKDKNILFAFYDFSCPNNIIYNLASYFLKTNIPLQQALEIIDIIDLDYLFGKRRKIDCLTWRNYFIDKYNKLQKSGYYSISKMLCLAEIASEEIRCSIHHNKKPTQLTEKEIAFIYAIIIDCIKEKDYAFISYNYFYNDNIFKQYKEYTGKKLTIKHYKNTKSVWSEKLSSIFKALENAGLLEITQERHKPSMFVIGKNSQFYKGDK